MATRKATPLDAGLIARKGEAAPAQIPTPTNQPAVSLPHGTKDTVALTVRLDQERYRRLVAYAAGFVPRKTHSVPFSVNVNHGFHRVESPEGRHQ